MGDESPFPEQPLAVRTAEPAGSDSAALAALFGTAALEHQSIRPRGRPGFALLAERGSEVVGAALIGHERRALGSATLEVAALELKLRVPAAREPLLAAAAGAAVEAELPFLTLRGSAATLAHVGLAPCALHAAVALAGLAPAPALIRRACADDAEELAALAAATRGLPLAALRTLPDWRWLLAKPTGWLLLEDQRGRTVAYARVVEGATVEAASADAGAARELVAGLAAAGVNQLLLPLAHGVVRAALLLGATATVQAPPAEAEGELWGLVELPVALEALAPELELRLTTSRYRGWRGAVRLEGAFGSATLRCAEDRVAVAAAAGPTDVLAAGLSLSGVVQLLLGFRPAADLRSTGELRCAEVDLGLLDVLFPAL